MHWLSQLGHYIAQYSRVPSSLRFSKKKVQYLLAANFELNQVTECVIDEQPDTLVLCMDPMYVQELF